MGELSEGSACHFVKQRLCEQETRDKAKSGNPDEQQQSDKRSAVKNSYSFKPYAFLIAYYQFYKGIHKFQVRSKPLDNRLNFTAYKPPVSVEVYIRGNKVYKFKGNVAEQSEQNRRQHVLQDFRFS